MSSTVASRLSPTGYLERLGPLHPQGLIFGFTRGTPVPIHPENDALLQRMAAALGLHLRHHGGGAALRSPIDLVLDVRGGLVLHPAVAVVRWDKLNIVREERQVWGSPNVVMELLVRATARRIRCSNVRWYRDYGVDECWLIDVRGRSIEVLDFRGHTRIVPYIFTGETRIQSRALPRFDTNAADLFAGWPDERSCRIGRGPIAGCANDRGE